jgi:hypothetical protein
VSAYVALALEEKAKLDDLSALLDEMLAESGGPLSPAEMRAADLAIGVWLRRRRSAERRPASRPTTVRCLRSSAAINGQWSSSRDPGARVWVSR